MATESSTTTRAVPQAPMATEGSSAHGGIRRDTEGRRVKRKKKEGREKTYRRTANRSAQTLNPKP